MALSVERTRDGRRLVVSRAVRAEPDAVWDLLVDTTRWPEWGPSVSAVDCDERRISAGTKGRVQVLGGPWVPFEISDCADFRWTWDVAGIPATGHRVTGQDDRSCRVAFEIPPLASAYAPVCRRALGRIERLATATTAGQ